MLKPTYYTEYGHMECKHIYSTKRYKSNYMQCKDHLFQSWLSVLGTNEIETIFVLAYASSTQTDFIGERYNSKHFNLTRLASGIMSNNF
jgi:hypothetical protein